ncbi:MAG: hypothetical protein WCK34_10890 [Bacteroidota bacterium]
MEVKDKKEGCGGGGDLKLNLKTVTPKNIFSDFRSVQAIADLVISVQEISFVRTRMQPLFVYVFAPFGQNYYHCDSLLL